ncbi:MAG: pyrroline-5-carboxylate reductase dimerization domain-containing protein [Roseovarius sp.]|nr:pyrroline-5-carboxylate reductase dimerization domain-containing protein [Roseovarius sp.]
MRLGVIGVGHLAGAILKGLIRAGHAPEDILLSPRGQGPALARRDGFSLAADNAALVQACDTVLLAVRPADAAGALAGLPWRDGQIVLSACAGVSLAQVAGPASPAEVVRIMPITAAELGASPTLIHPYREAVAPLLGGIGSLITLDSEDQFEAATVSAAIYGWAQSLIQHGAHWSADAGMDDDAARQLVARTFVAAGRMVAEQEAPMPEILAGLCTPGGITEAGLRHLDGEGVPEAWRGACDVVLNKLRGGQ